MIAHNKGSEELGRRLFDPLGRVLSKLAEDFNERGILDVIRCQAAQLRQHLDSLVPHTPHIIRAQLFKHRQQHANKHHFLADFGDVDDAFDALFPYSVDWVFL